MSFFNFYSFFILRGRAVGTSTTKAQTRKVALCDFLTRRFLEAAKRVGADKRTQSGGWSGAKGGEITIDEPGQHILERSSVLVDDRDGSVEARFSVAMPARGELLPHLFAEKCCAQVRACV